MIFKQRAVALAKVYSFNKKGMRIGKTPQPSGLSPRLDFFFQASRICCPTLFDVIFSRIQRSIVFFYGKRFTINGVGCNYLAIQLDFICIRTDSSSTFKSCFARLIFMVSKLIFLDFSEVPRLIFPHHSEHRPISVSVFWSYPKSFCSSDNPNKHPVPLSGKVIID